MAYLTQTDITNLAMVVSKSNFIQSVSDQALLKKIIVEDEASIPKQEMRAGTNYYRNEADILSRKIYYWLDQRKVEDSQATNQKLNHGFHKVITDQKVSYIVGKPIAVSPKEETDEEYQKAFIDTMGKRFDDTMNSWVKGSTNKGVEWLHFYIDSAGKFNYTIIDAKECIPVYDSTYQNELLELIRYYPITEVDSKGVRVIKKKVEWYRKDDVTFYIEQKDEKGETAFVLDVSELTNGGNPRPHWIKSNTNDTIAAESGSWGRVPFVPLMNNDEWISDLKFYKNLVDDYDLNESASSNDLIDIQKLIWILKNYEGSSLKEFTENIRKFKAISVGEDGGASTASADLPTEAHKQHQERSEDNIFVFGMAVNMKIDNFGSSPSGIALQFMYALLDLKANIIIRKLDLALNDVSYFVAFYLREIEREGAGEFDPEGLEFTFNKSIPINEAEKITNLKNSVGMISDETIIAEHPYVDDPVAEQERVDKKKEEQQAFIQEQMNNNTDNDE